MKTKASESSSNELQLELKYCERCGGLWLRPAGGGQIYCAACAREMAKLPATPHAPENARAARGPRWGVDVGEFDGYGEDEGMDLDAGGVA